MALGPLPKEYSSAGAMEKAGMGVGCGVGDGVSARDARGVGDGVAGAVGAVATGVISGAAGAGAQAAREKVSASASINACAQAGRQRFFRCISPTTFLLYFLYSIITALRLFEYIFESNYKI